MSKEIRSTIEQIQRWIKSTNSDRDLSPFIGVLEALREAQSSSPSAPIKQSWPSMGHSTSTK
ncbi:unnamed protein product, partial [Rotaria magnacalcarata]